MTVSAPTSGLPGDTPAEGVTLTVDGFETTVPKGTLIIRAAEQLGIQIPRFCDHPLLDPLGACRQCIVEVEGQRKPLTACTTTVTEGMVVKTQLTSPVAEKAQRGMIELLLINHPLDCPICDKGGECPLQNQTMTNGSAQSRFRDVKRTYPKPIAISTQVLLDRERCVLCARCTRFSQQIAGDPFIELFERSALEQVAIYEDEPFESYFSGNTVQICPVGALTGAAYRFRARPFDLVSTPSVCEHCASGCAQRTDHRRGKVLRRLAGDDPAVNEEWNCDKGRWAFTYATQPDRLRTPLVRGEDGELREASWTEALGRAAQGLLAARDAARDSAGESGRESGGESGGVGVLPGGRLTVEDAYAYAKFARVALGSDDIDFRARPGSAEELAFLAAEVVGRYPGDGTGVSYADLDAAPAVLLVAFEPEEESPIVFLRLRKAAAKAGLPVFGVAPFATAGLTKVFGTLLSAVPGEEPSVLDQLAGERPVPGHERVHELLRRPGAVICVGERLGAVPGGLSAVARLARASGARLAWIPRRAGERGALEVGALPGLLPGGRRVDDATHRAEVAHVWPVDTLPSRPGRDLHGILAAAGAGELGALVVGGVDPDDLPDPAAAVAALDAVPFLVSLELRASPVTARADVVLPVAPAVEKAGTYLDWEGRPRPFDLALQGTGAMPDLRVLDTLAQEMDVVLGLPDVATARREIEALGRPVGGRPPAPDLPAPRAGRREPPSGQAVLATWHWLLDCGRMQDGEPFLAGTAKAPRLHLSAATAAEIGAQAGEPVTVSTDLGRVSLPLVVAAMPDRVVWLPTNAPGCAVRRDLGAGSGDIVSIRARGAR